MLQVDSKKRPAQARDDYKKWLAALLFVDRLLKNSEKIVEKAFEKEKINWKGFISYLRKPLLKLSFSS